MKLFLSIALAFIATTTATNEQTRALRAAVHTQDESGKITGSVPIPEFANEAERETFMNSVCSNIENLLGGTVTCACTPQILKGSLVFDCDSFRDVTIREKIIYTPSFTGVFGFSLGSLDISFGAGYCLDGFSVFVEEIGTFINAGDVCFSGRIKLDSDLNSTTPLVTPSLDSCTFTAGIFGMCEACDPCEASNGQPGFSVVCDFVEVAACVPLALPVSRNSQRVNPQIFGEQIADGMLTLLQPEIARVISDAAEAPVAAPVSANVVVAAQPTKVKKVKKDKKPKKNPQ